MSLWRNITKGSCNLQLACGCQIEYWCSTHGNAFIAICKLVVLVQDVNCCNDHYYILYHYHHWGEHSETPTGSWRSAFLIYLIIIMVSQASWIPGYILHEEVWLLCCNEEGVAQCFIQTAHLDIASSTRLTMPCIPLLLSLRMYVY